MFVRKIQKTIEQYFESDASRILVIEGARQIGKSYIIRYMCNKKYSNVIEINLKEDWQDQRIFEKVTSTRMFYLQLSALYGQSLGNNEDTIIFLDEIQVYPHLLSMLKPLNADKRYKYIVSGSELGVTLKKTFIPMGSIDIYKMYPMDFEEFLWANGVGMEAIDYLHECFNTLSPVDESLHITFLNYFKQYLICGGLPDATKAFVENLNVYETRKVHSEIFEFYKDDASQYDIEHKLKISRIYDMMPSYMENKVKRIEANKIENKKQVSLDKYLDEFDYLLSSGIAIGVKAITEAKYPLKSSVSKNFIKLYYNDVGLLTNYLFENNIQILLNNDKGVNLGSVYETVAAQELKAHGHDLYYFDKRKMGEVDFLIDDKMNGCCLPIEIKSGNDQANFRAIPKLVNNEEYHIQKGYVFGNKNLMEEKNKLITMPIYLIMFV